jgi:mRNA interferase MazF
VVISQGEIWWADSPVPASSAPGFRRPVVVIATVICLPLTSNLKWALAPGNVRLSPRMTGLPKESVANVSQIITIDKKLLKARVGKLPSPKLELLLSGIDVVLGK